MKNRTDRHLRRVNRHGDMHWPNRGDTVFILTGSGRVVGIKWTGSDKQRDRMDFLGVYKTIDEAKEAYTLIRELCQRRASS